MDERAPSDVAEELQLAYELERLLRLLRGDRHAYDDLEIDYSRPFPEELNGA